MLNAMCDTNHHTQKQYCTTRLRYRQGRQLTAVKVYTTANESIHLLVFGVPKVNLHNEIKGKFLRYGALHFVRCVTDEISKTIKLEIFTDVYHIKFQKLEHSRRAKRFLDACEFYGGILHISYAPEYETEDETRRKLQQRINEVKFRMILSHRKQTPNRTSEK